MCIGEIPGGPPSGGEGEGRKGILRAERVGKGDFFEFECPEGVFQKLRSQSAITPPYTVPLHDWVKIAL